MHNHPDWLIDSREAGYWTLDFGQMTARLLEALLNFGLSHPELKVAEAFSSRYYLGMHGRSRDAQTVEVEMHPKTAAFPRTGRTYAQLNEARSLAKYKTLPRAIAPWALDSGSGSGDGYGSGGGSGGDDGSGGGKG